MKGRGIVLFFLVLMFALFSGDRSSNAADMTTQDRFDSLQRDHILAGRSNGDPALEANLTRAEMAVILVRMYKLQLITDESAFSDTRNHWAQKAGYIEAVKRAQLMQGGGNDMFNPDSYVTKEQLAAILLKAVKVKAEANSPVPLGKFSPWAQNIVAKALKEQLISPSEDYTKFIDRGETVDDLYPLYQEIKDVNTAKPEPITYSLELGRWNVYNDGTHPTETTEGLNRALQWAYDQGYNVFKVPTGMYLISKGTGQYDKNSRINMVSNMTLIIDNDTVIQKETNEYEGYSLLYIGPSLHDVVIKGGTYKGDKDTHRYSSGSTHESGYGILAEGVKNLVIDGVKTFNFTGDGICVGAHFEVISSLYENEFESGGIDEKGNLVADSQRIRIKDLSKTKLNLQQHPKRKTIELERPTGITNSNLFDIYFYKSDGTFISSAKDQEFYWSYIPIPGETAYFNAVFHGHAVVGTNKNVVGGDGIHGMGVYTKSKSDNVIIQNSESAFNRRQGITIGGGDNILITNNTLHDIKGTAPQSGIDAEGGVFPNTRLTITRNQFYNNKTYNLILFDGRDAVVEQNQFGPAPIGLAISNPFSGAKIEDNTFDGSGIIAGHDASFMNNKINNASVSLGGKGIKVDGLELTDSSLTLNSSIPFGIDVSNVTLTNTGAKDVSFFVINGQPIHLTNTTLQGPTTRFFGGSVASGSTYDNLKILGYDATLNLDLPPGTYNNCEFAPRAGGVQAAELNDAATYVFNNCQFKMNRTALVINNKDATATISNSTFQVQAPTGYGVALIEAQSAKELTVENSTLDAKNNTVNNFELIKIGKLGGAKTPTQVLKATINGNTIYSNLLVSGISTLDGGNNAPPYHIENNVLYTAKLQLKANDIFIDNR